MTTTWPARIDTLAPRTINGPTYSRGVVEALHDHRLFASRTDIDAAEHYLLLAEKAAGLIGWDELEERDPFCRGAAEAERALEARIS